jgi:hypothetical protein
LPGKVDDKGIRAAADQLVATGMKDAGYVYVNIDDTWEGERDASGVLHANAKFPDMKALADYVHSKGLKIGIYSSPGPKTCGGYVGSLGHEEQDAQLYASWGIDYLKYDLCSFIGDVLEKQAPDDKAAQMRLMIAAYTKMDKALKATGRPIVYSFCQYGWDAVWEWGPAAGGNLWRTTGDVTPDWDRIYAIVSQQEGLEAYAGPGHWNDPDMLEVGNGKLTLAENRTHFYDVGDAGRAFAGWQRPAQHEAGDQGHPDQPRRDRHRSGRAGPAGRAHLLRRRGRGLDPAAERGRFGHRRGQRGRQPLLDPPIPPEPAQARLGERRRARIYGRAIP